MTSIDPTSDETIGHLHDRLTPGVTYPIAGTGWSVRRPVGAGWTARLGTVRVGGRPVGPHMQRFLERAWTAGRRDIPRLRREYQARMSAMHSAYRRRKR